MALISLKSFRFYSPNTAASRSLVMTLSKSLNFISGQQKSQNYSSLAMRMLYSKVKSRYMFCRNNHVQLRIQSLSVNETMHLCEDPGNSPISDNRWMDEQMFFKKLKGLDTSKEIFKFLSSLEIMSDIMASAALQRISEVEVDDNSLKNSEAVLENEVFRALCFQFEYESSKLSNTGLFNALQALIKLRVDPQSSLIAGLLSESQERLVKGQLTIKNLCDLGETLLELEGPSCATLEQILNHMQEKDIEMWSPIEMVMVYRMLQMSVREGKQYQDLLNRMNNVTLTIASQLSPKFMSIILNSLVVLRQTQAFPLVITLCKHSVKHVPYFTDDELVNVLEAFLYFGHCEQIFTEALETHVPKSIFTMHPETVSKIMKYCCQKIILSKPIFDAVAEVFISDADGFTTNQIAECIVPFGTLNYLPPSGPLLFGKLESILRAHFSQFQPHTLLNLLHSFVLIQCYPVNFLAKIFSPYFLQQLQAQPPGLDRFVTSQLTQLFLTATLECPFYEGPKLLPKYQVKASLMPVCSLDVHLLNRVKTGLLYLLKKRIYFASDVSTPYFYTVDIEIKLDEEGFVLPAAQCEEVHRRIALCVDGQNRFCINSHHLLGEEAIKQRHLKLLGYEVVQIPFFEIESLKNCRKMAAYLRKKIFPHAYGLRC
ncbi:FAST kinase domain-containing protein 3, mitochondrial isoform X1 [Apteryx rowi]|uniref:FAST kinase domain-containing protein 3, mitochondrial isoform X1 n=1 Tax=Apteryx rowi TaxID=308060 RepID=UPI000E1D2DAA|nr:FAST kinase domain-containing protein 3, mitochondrial isoform X1 [Apteryx rowi]XP_025938380.1 FAST kinase domain-containing protein 3, mitochondrial isoform X1 [Apteryx rowi]XP_025938381.1 FAST kinase domain-containing protein 3, mitochondrial isoform X1 [Apteryx rowi]